MEEYRARTAAARPLPLHTEHQSRRATAFNRLFAAVYGGGILGLFYYHLASLLKPASLGSFFVSISLFFSDVVLAFMWVTTQSYRINSLRRREFPENLKALVKDSDFPAMDVFICTADPYKEPPMSVVNTALSVMAYDYPAGKISVYVSDDGGSAVTLFALMEAARFAGEWLPFCRKNDVVERNPDAFFASNQYWNSESEKMKIMYEKMKMRVGNVLEKGKVGDEFVNGEEERTAFNKWTKSFTRKQHPAVIQVLLESGKNKDMIGESLPNLIYVSREKSVTSHHHFKAGALNALLRVSAIMSNAPIIVTLDCDMYSNDPQTPSRALCYFLDSKLMSNLGYVQFPQRFHGVNKNDIYGCELKRLFINYPIGMDGLLGPCYVGTGCFFVRRAFFGGPSSPKSPELPELSPNLVVEKKIQSEEVLDLAHLVAGCGYENETKWGYELGFRYGSLVEDHFTGYRLQSEGWNSVFCNPNRAAFYGQALISLLDTLNQAKRWAIGLLEIIFSKYNPITFGVRSMGLLMGLSYANNAFWPSWSIPVTVYAFLPPLALINGISIFPKVWSRWFVLYAFLVVGGYGQDLVEFMVVGGTFRRWWNDQRMWNIRALSSYWFGFMEFLANSVGISAMGFDVTSKLMDSEQSKRYEKGLFEFGLPSPMFLPLATAAALNLAAFAAGFIGIWKGGGGAWGQVLVGEMLVAGFAVANCWPIYEAMAFRADAGKLPPKITFLSLLLAFLLCSFFAAFFHPSMF
ncbi:cellulose synthase-like protein G3 isoform X2 [Momordica charantia]|uniref:Cellulose synthase-like protein G3 isoform X2 n=1 Tax=Momordica charantia TaxID=3673 RepID=A0A6J1C455_MOMCH|nr:cellulose synthase-like protein G3 isoform X2 [Momordica charantia]